MHTNQKRVGTKNRWTAPSAEKRVGGTVRRCRKTSAGGWHRPQDDCTVRRTIAGGGASGVAHQTSCEIRAQGPVSLFLRAGLAVSSTSTSTSTAWTRCLVPVGRRLVAFSCALRRDKLDGSERCPSSANAASDFSYSYSYSYSCTMER